MNSAATTPQTIACTLSAGDYRDRLQQITGLARDSLISHDRKGLVLTLRYDASAADRVKEMVRREQECCPFLNFTVREETSQIVVNVTAPEEAREASETMFEQFVATNGNTGNTPARVALVCAGMAAACGPACVAPMVLPSIVLAGTGTILAWLADSHSWMTALAAVSVAAAWAWIWLQSRKSGRRPNKSTTYTVGVATVLALLALAWPLFEEPLIRSFSG
jgi:hypothetical protein